MSAPPGGPLGLLLLLGCGYAYVRAADRPILLTLALAHLAGAAALAAGLTAGLALTARADPLWGYAGLALLAAAGFARRVDRSPRRPGTRAPLSRLEWLLAGLLALGLLTLLLRGLLLPLDWDGWAIWQLKAKALTAGTLRDLLTAPEYGYSHPDYPLLVPAHTWWLTGARFDPRWAQLGGSLFFLDLLVLFYAEAERRLGRTPALLGCVVLVSWPGAVKHAVSGFADVPMAAYALGTAVFLARGDLRLGAACLAGALLAKNEGLFTLGAALALAWLGPLELGHDRPRVRLRSLATVLVTALVTAGLWTATKRRWHLYADMLDPAHWAPGLPGLLPGRMAVILREYVRQALAVGPRYPGWGLFWPAALLGLAQAVRLRLRETAPFWILATAHLAGATAAYLVTGTRVENHISTSVDRLWLHTAPAVLLATLQALWGPGGAGECDTVRETGKDSSSARTEKAPCTS